MFWIKTVCYFPCCIWIRELCKFLIRTFLSPPGVIIVPSAGVGIVLGGYIIKKLKLGARESAKLAMICSGVSLLCFSTLFIVGCESINLGGINIPYTTGWVRRGNCEREIRGGGSGGLSCITADKEEPRQCSVKAVLSSLIQKNVILSVRFPQ